MIKEEFEGWGVLKNFFFKKLYEQNNVYVFEVTNNNFINYEVFKTSNDTYPFDNCYIYNNYDDAYNRFTSIRDGKNYNKVCKEQGIEIAEVGDGKNIKDNRYKVRKRRTVIKPSNGTNRDGHCVNRRS